MNTLSLENLSVGYGYKPVLEHVNAELNGGEWIHFHGHNGAGKSTLLKVIAALKHPLEGELLWNGDPVEGLYRETYRHKIRYFGHERALFQDLTVQDNWDLYAELFQLAGTTVSNVAGDVSGNRTVGRLSRGETQRVELATLWPLDIPVYILDEPFSSLDEDCRQLLREFFQQCTEKDNLVITATPERLDGANRYFHVTDEGRVIEQ